MKSGILNYSILGSLLLFFCPSLFAQWEVVSSGTTQQLNEIIFPVADTGFVVGNNGTFLRTYDSGESWIQLDLGTTDHLNDIYFFNAQSGFVVGDNGFFAGTKDGGETWDITTLIDKEPVKLSSVFFTSSLIGYAGGSNDLIDGIIFKTTDGGISWDITDSSDSALDRDFTRIVFPVPDTGYAITRGMCLKSVDAGDTWFVTDTALVASGNMFSILEDAHFFSADTGFVVGWYSPFCGYTANGGENWTDQFVFNNQWYAIDFPSRQTGYMVGWGQLVKTIDGGQSWLDITSPLIASASIYAMSFINDSTGYTCGDNGLILRTNSGGVTSISDELLSSNVSVYPNPAAQDFLITFSNPASKTHTLFIYDSRGVLVHKAESITTSRVIIDRKNMPGGIYALQLIKDGRIVYTQKLILE
ncbi:MAG: T9SS type A sorting domain-containing protein [Saprospiraceae bacterium]|nr:T9SS type A sorting domain-containing protein [Saprospiraceae bacterium]